MAFADSHRKCSLQSGRPRPNVGCDPWPALCTDWQRSAASNNAAYCRRAVWHQEVRYLTDACFLSFNVVWTVSAQSDMKQPTELCCQSSSCSLFILANSLFTVTYITISRRICCLSVHVSAQWGIRLHNNSFCVDVIWQKKIIKWRRDTFVCH